MRTDAQRLFMTPLASTIRRSFVYAESYPDRQRFYVDVQGQTKDPDAPHPRGESDTQRLYREQLQDNAIRAIQAFEAKAAAREGRIERSLSDLIKPDVYEDWTRRHEPSYDEQVFLPGIS